MVKQKLHIKRDDTVVVISGKDKSKRGRILRALPQSGRVVVEGVNIVHRHTKPRGQSQAGGIIDKEAAIHASNVMLVCSKCDKATRIAYKIADGKKTRICKKCGAELS